MFQIKLICRSYQIWLNLSCFYCSFLSTVYWMCCFKPSKSDLSFSTLKWRRINLNLFLTWDSVLPGILSAISFHLLPNWSHFLRKSMSFSIVHLPLLISGFSAFNHLSLHCLPFLSMYGVLVASVSLCFCT